MTERDTLPAGAARVAWAGESLVLLPERAVWWPDRSTVFVADLHLGKDSSFRARSIPVPVGTAAHDLVRLDAVRTATGATRLVVLGDFFHDFVGRSDELSRRLEAWRDRNGSLELVVIRGNHDAWAGDVPPQWGASVLDGPVREGPFVLVHAAGDEGAAPGFVLSGHVHPGVRLRGGGASVVLPCFRAGTGGAVLPAFGSFTGIHVVRPRRQDEVHVVADGSVLRVQ